MKLSQLEFSELLVDTLFGLIIYFGIDSFLDIAEPVHFVFYFFCNLIVIHWWLLYKSANDAFGKEISDSLIYLIFCLTELFLIEFLVLHSRSFDYKEANYFLIILFVFDSLWAFMWKNFGKWGTHNKDKIRIMEMELKNKLAINLPIIGMYTGLAVAAFFIDSEIFVGLYILIYSIYIVLSFRKNIIDIDVY